MKKVLSLLLAAAMIFTGVVSMSGCQKADQGMVLNVGAYPDTVDPALNSAVDGGTYIIHVFSGLIGYEQDADKKLQLVPQCAVELPKAEKLADGKVSYTFKLRDDLKWSDGKALTAQDFVYSWNRAADPATGASYSYMFDIIDGYDELSEAYDKDGKLKVEKKPELNVKASEDGKELTVVLKVNVPYFYELCAFPAYMPVRKDMIEAKGDAWATSPDSYIGNGAYKVTEFSQTQMVLEKNENYFNADKVVTDKLVFAFNSDDASLLSNYKNGSYKFIDSVPNNEIEALQKQYADEFVIAPQLGTYYVSFNVNDPALKDFSHAEKTKIRQALGLMVDRNYIAKEIGKSGQVPASGFVAKGLTEPDGSEYVSKNGLNRDGKGYYSVDEADYKGNCDKAMKILSEVAASSKKFKVEGNKVVGFPTLTYITNKGSGHEAIAANLQSKWAGYGIELKVEVQEWATFLNTRKDGNYSVARNGWLSDYNDPISFLDMWITSSGNNDSQFGKGEHAKYAAYDGGKTWADSYDKLIAEVKASSDPAKRFELMHKAEDILMETGAICPLYYYTDVFMCNKDIQGFFCSPLGFKYFQYASLKDAK